MNFEDKLQKIFSSIKEHHIIDKEKGIWWLFGGYEDFPDLAKRKGKPFEHLGEIEYEFINLDFSNGGIDEYRYFSENLENDVYVYQIAHAYGDDVDFQIYASLTRLGKQEINDLIRAEDKKLKQALNQKC